jgi:hypothetical protein
LHTSTRRASNALVFVFALAIGFAALAPSTAGASDFSDKNQPAYWENLGYGTCVKNEKPSTPYVLAAPPAGTTWTMLVVKAGSESSTNDPHAEYPNPVPGPYYHPSGKTISHVILCSRPGGGTTTTTQPTTTTDSTCGNYTPRSLVTDVVSAEPGAVVTISGAGGASDTLTFTISGTSVTTRSLGTVVVGPSGTFSKSVVIPDDYPAGTYTITVRSNRCGRTGTVSIATQSVNRSGCGSGNPYVIVRGAATSWNLITGTPAFNTAKPITLKLTQRAVGGVSYTLYSGSWGTGVKTLTVPASAPLDQYFLVQTGSQQGNNKPRTESCPVRIADSMPATSTIGSSHPSAPASTVLQISVVTVICGALLLRLRQGHSAQRRRAVS